MRLPIILNIILLVQSTIVLSQTNNVRIDGQILGYDGTKKVNYGISPVFGSGNNGSLQPDSLGRFTILKSINETEFFFMYYSKNNVTHTCKLILKPGNYYSFISEGDSFKKWNTHYAPTIYRYEKTNDNDITYFAMDMGSVYLNLIDNGTSGALYHDEWDLFQPDELINNLHAKIKTQDSVFNILLEEGKIDDDFYEIAKLNVEYTQAYRLAQTISDTWTMGNRYKIEDTLIMRKLYEIYPTIFEQYPVKGVKMEHHFCYSRYVDLYLTFLADSKDGTFKPQKRRGAAAIEPRQLAGEVLSGEAYKNYNMGVSMSYVATLDLHSPQYAKDFLLENPEMKHTQGGEFLESVLIPNTEEFIRLSKEDFSKGVILLDDIKPIKSFSELLDSLKGKPFLIDYWATWCMPCRYQFQFNDTLKPFLEKNGIEVVYIAEEYNNSREQWEAFIKAYDLKGYHFRSNDEFKSDFEKYAGRIVKFPTYIIVNGKGFVVEPDAYFPSQVELLFNQLIEKLKL